jgi:hypothetical protein
MLLWKLKINAWKILIFIGFYEFLLCFDEKVYDFDVL